MRLNSISYKLLLGVGPAALVLIGVSVLLHNHFQEEEMLAQAQTSVETYATLIRESLVSMMVKNYEVDESFISRVYSIKEIDSLRIVLNDLHLRPELLDAAREKRLEAKRKAYGPPDSVDLTVLQTGEAAYLRSGDAYRATVPFKATTVCQECHRVPLNYAIGAVDIHVSLQRISEAQEANWKRSAMIFVLFLITTIGIGTLVFRRVVGMPVEDLLEATRRMRKGDLKTRGPLPRSQDELGTLTLAFEEMRRSLADTLNELALKNRSLQDSLHALRNAQDELIKSERLSTIGQMASTIIHDFKNPMTLVLAYAEVLRKKTDLSSEARTQYFDGIVRAVRRMSDMTRDLLDFSRGQIVLDKKSVSVRDLIQDVSETVELNLRAHHVELQIRQEYDDAVNVDLEHLRRALINVINNAQEAMPSGGKLIVGVRQRNGFIEFRLSDTGVGIPGEIRDRIFEPFLTYGKSDGTGLGLAITKRVVEAHGGTISFESAVGIGTTFVLAIPA